MTCRMSSVKMYSEQPEMEFLLAPVQRGIYEFIFKNEMITGVSEVLALHWRLAAVLLHLTGGTLARSHKIKGTVIYVVLCKVLGQAFWQHVMSFVPGRGQARRDNSQIRFHSPHTIYQISCLPRHLLKLQVRRKKQSAKCDGQTGTESFKISA